MGKTLVRWRIEHLSPMLGLGAEPLACPTQGSIPRSLRRNSMSVHRFTLPLLASLVLVACSSDDDPNLPQTGELIVRTQAATPFSAQAAAAAASMGDPSSFTLTFYRFYLAEDADCSSAELLADNGTGGVAHDLLTNPTLFTVTGDPGTYNCVVMRISDVLTFTSASSFGPCVSGTTYTTDVYRTGETNWRDVDGAPIIGSGTDAAPVDNRPDVFFSTSPSAVIARGASSNQVVPLGTGAVIPGTNTFVYDVSGAVADEGGSCRILPGAYEFR